LSRGHIATDCTARFVPRGPHRRAIAPHTAGARMFFSVVTLESRPDSSKDACRGEWFCVHCSCLSLSHQTSLEVTIGQLCSGGYHMQASLHSASVLSLALPSPRPAPVNARGAQMQRTECALYTRRGAKDGIGYRYAQAACQAWRIAQCQQKSRCIRRCNDPGVTGQRLCSRGKEWRFTRSSLAVTRPNGMR
jgi:hypothetical protein